MRRIPSLSGRRAVHRPGPEQGATAVEYAIIVTLIAIAVVAGVTALGVAVQGLFAVPGGV